MFLTKFFYSSSNHRWAIMWTRQSLRTYSQTNRRTDTRRTDTSNGNSRSAWKAKAGVTKRLTSMSLCNSQYEGVSMSWHHHGIIPFHVTIASHSPGSYLCHRLINIHEVRVLHLHRTTFNRFQAFWLSFCQSDLSENMQIQAFESLWNLEEHMPLSNSLCIWMA